MHVLNEDQKLFVDQVRKMVADKVAPRAAEIDRKGEFPWDLKEVFQEMGLLGLSVPEQYVGCFQGHLYVCLAVEEIAKACASSSLVVQVQALGWQPVVIAGSEEHKKKYGPKVASGEALITFGLTVFRDLTEAIVVGFALGSVLFIHRMARTTVVDARAVPLVAEDQADGAFGDRAPYDADAKTDPEVVVFRISGAFFFGAAASIGAVLDRIGDGYSRLVIDFAAVPFIDSTAAHTIEGLAHKARRTGVQVILTDAAPGVRRDLEAHGVLPPLVTFADRIEDAGSVAGR